MLGLNPRKSKVAKISRFLLVFVLIASWIFSGYPQIQNFPPEIQEARAIQTGIPTGDILTGLWTEGVPGADGDSYLWNEMDETTPDGDTTYVLASGDNTTCKISISALEDPGIHTGHELHAWGRATGGTGPERLIVALYQGNTLIAESGNLTNRNSIHEERTYLLPEANVANISDYSALRIHLTSENLGSTETILVTKVEFQIPDVAGPITTFIVGGTETGTKDTSLTTITFPADAPEAIISVPYNNLDGSGDPQVLSADASAPVAKIKNTGSSTYNIILEITTWTNSVVNMEYYNIAADGAINVQTVTAELSNANGAARSVSTAVSIAAGTYKDLYLKLLLSSSAGKTGASTLTILGETP